MESATPDMESLRREYANALESQRAHDAMADECERKLITHRKMATAHGDIAEGLLGLYPQLRQDVKPAAEPTRQEAHVAATYSGAEVPRGQDAVMRVLRMVGHWMPVGDVVAEFERLGWREPGLPRDNPVRNALERCVDNGHAERMHEGGRVLYRARATQKSFGPAAVTAGPREAGEDPAIHVAVQTEPENVRLPA